MNRSDLFAMCKDKTRPEAQKVLHDYFYRERALKDLLDAPRMYKSDGSSRAMTPDDAVQVLLEEVYGV